MQNDPVTRSPDERLWWMTGRPLADIDLGPALAAAKASTAICFEELPEVVQRAVWHLAWQGRVFPEPRVAAFSRLWAARRVSRQRAGAWIVVDLLASVLFGGGAGGSSLALNQRLTARRILRFPNVE